MDAIVILVLLVALALAAPRWGWDSTDGVDSPEYRRRAAWQTEQIGRTRRGDAAARPARRAVAEPRRPALPRAAAPVYSLAVGQPRAQGHGTGSGGRLAEGGAAVVPA